MRIGFTGTRTGPTAEQYGRLLKLVYNIHFTEIHHGDCVGCDDILHGILLTRFKQDFIIVVHPPEVDFARAFRGYKELTDHIVVREPLPYLKRNHNIVDETDLLIACPQTKLEQQRSGTWATVRYARKQDKQIIIIQPSGSLRVSRLTKIMEDILWQI